MRQAGTELRSIPSFDRGGIPPHQDVGSSKTQILAGPVANRREMSMDGVELTTADFSGW